MVCAVSRTGRGLAFVDDPGIMTFVVDLTVDSEVTALVDDLARRVGDVSILVHSAGLWIPGRLESAGVADLDAQYRINLRAPYLLTQLLLPALRATRGHVVLIDSAATGRAGVGQYAATKFALRALAESMRDELNADGVRVTSVHVGRTATDLQKAVHQAEGKQYDPDRLIQPEEVASTVLMAVTLPATAQLSELWLLPQDKV
jgi:NADP-dependent 3-hydroxy acid dehydrogenase YdfG